MPVGEPVVLPVDGRPLGLSPAEDYRYKTYAYSCERSFHSVRFFFATFAAKVKIKNENEWKMYKKNKNITFFFAVTKKSINFASQFEKRRTIFRCFSVCQHCLHSLSSVFSLAFNDSLAQLVEHNTFNVGVMGSNPMRVTLNLFIAYWSSDICNFLSDHKVGTTFMCSFLIFFLIEFLHILIIDY